MSSGLCRLSKGGWLSRQPPPWAWLFPASVLCPCCLTGSAEWKLLVSLVPFSGWVCFPRFTPETILSFLLSASDKILQSCSVELGPSAR